MRCVFYKIKPSLLILITLLPSSLVLNLLPLHTPIHLTLIPLQIRTVIPPQLRIVLLLTVILEEAAAEGTVVAVVVVAMDVTKISNLISD
ncbi:hypothetical protein BVC80_1603g23 [Macleaya cordata]|uniref:Uncharacterized protein n=1 Tax=Macleaya cordata TaxID=56857 RepID=A0A200QA19_MACCD|nr:hypothetical protein BVC80_1603g23 [Macleaya cordata]